MTSRDDESTTIMKEPIVSQGLSECTLISFTIHTNGRRRCPSYVFCFNDTVLNNDKIVKGRFYAY